MLVLEYFSNNSFFTFTQVFWLILCPLLQQVFGIIRELSLDYIFRVLFTPPIACLFIKLRPWPKDSKGIFRSLSQAGNLPPVHLSTCLPHKVELKAVNHPANSGGLQ